MGWEIQLLLQTLCLLTLYAMSQGSKVPKNGALQSCKKAMPETISVCPDFAQTSIIDLDDPDADSSLAGIITDERTIADQGHWNGLIPNEYDLRLSYEDQSHVSGIIKIKVRLNQSSDLILLNHNSSYSDIAYNSITIKPLCQRVAGKRNPDADKTECISNATSISAHGILALSLRNVSLHPQYAYEISIEFDARARDIDDDSLGLVQINSAGSLSTSALFVSREPRSVFPCFDHPSLKARFKLCISHPENMTVLSSAPIDEDMFDDLSNGIVLNCFDDTPPMSTSSVSFAILTNYVYREENFAGNRRKPISIRLYIPKAYESVAVFDWIPAAANRAIEYMETHVTKERYPSKELKFVFVDLSKKGAASRIEHFGLIYLSLDDDNIKQNTKLGNDLVAHAVVHQWIGGVVTVSEWRYACLQEGVATFLQWRIGTASGDSTITHKATGMGEALEDALKKIHEPNIPARGTKTIVDDCSMTGFYLHAIFKWFPKKDVISSFVKALIKERKYGSFDLEYSNREFMSQLSNKSNLTLLILTFLSDVLTSPGPMSILAWKHNATCIVVRQLFVIDLNGPLPREITKEPPAGKIINLMMNIWYFNSTQSISVNPFILTEQDEIVCAHDASESNTTEPFPFDSFIIDPSYDVPFRRFYSMQNYYPRIAVDFKKVKINRAASTQDFCSMYMNGNLPLPVETEEELAKIDPKQFFNNTYKMIRGGDGDEDIGGTARGACVCCLTGTKYWTFNTDKRCTSMWNRTCANLRVVTRYDWLDAPSTTTTTSTSTTSTSTTTKTTITTSQTPKGSEPNKAGKGNETDNKVTTSGSQRCNEVTMGVVLMSGLGVVKMRLQVLHLA